MYQSAFLNAGTMATSAGVQPFASVLNGVPTPDNLWGREIAAPFESAAARNVAPSSARTAWKARFQALSGCSA